MKPGSSWCQTTVGSTLAAALFATTTTTAISQGTEKFIITNMAEKQMTALPEGELYWHIERFGSIEEAEAAATDTSLSGEFEGDVWLFTLADRTAAGLGGSPVTKIGPVERVDAPGYVLRINNAVAPKGAKSSIHSHPGAETFLVLSGQLTQHTPFGSHIVNAGGTLRGDAEQTMQVESTGDEELRQLIMFVVDAGRPFSEKQDHLN